MVKPSDLTVVTSSAGMAKCIERPLASSGDFPALLDNHLDLIEAYEICKANHDSLIKAVESFNTR